MNLRELIPGPVKYGIRLAQYVGAKVIGMQDPLFPPPWLQSVGGHFRSSGREFFGHFVTLGELKPTDRVLDAGSGVGRMAITLPKYLTTGTYDGFEIAAPSVKWCQQAYAGYPNFKFHHADVWNEFYNAGGKTKASEYRFPFPDGSFDFVYLTSVFTHMFKPDVENYLDEISRVLAPGGRALITVFLLNEPTRALMAQGKAMFNFRFPLDGCWTSFDDRPPEAAIAFEETDFRQMVEDRGLRIKSLHYGSWRGTPGPSVQEIVVAIKD